MSDWKKNARADLFEYNAVKLSLSLIPQQIKEMDEKMTSIRSATTDSTPIQGGTSGREDMLINCIDNKERLKINYSVARRKVERIERGLSTLSENELKVIDRFYLNRTNGHVERLCAELGYEKSQIYNIHDSGLKKFTLSMFGIVDL